jgi:hypothetical protein
MRPTERVLTLWSVGLLKSEAVVRWADQAILDTDVPSQELIDLACDGPEKCLKRAQFEFPARPIALSFTQAFALRALSTDLESEESTFEFGQWVARHAMGEDLDLPEVVFSYQVYDLLVECEDRVAASAFIGKELPQLLTRCREIGAPFLEQAGALYLPTDRPEK